MKIAGLEIRRANTAAAVIEERTKPSKPLASSQPRAELGDSGISIIHGVISEEYNSKLSGTTGIKIYDQMRRSDGTVRAALLACTLPIRRAEYFVQPAGEKKQHKDVADFVDKALREYMDISWDNFLRQALLMCAFGVMPFEKVYGIRQAAGKDYVVITKMAPRMPVSVQSWELTDGTFGIQQQLQTGGIAEIPGSKLLIFVNEKEGDNWWGMSMLRPAYKHWYFKDTFYKIDAVAFERQGLGVPLIEMPEGYTTNDEANARKAAEHLRASEYAYMLLPPGYKASMMNMGAGSTRDPHASIQHHNREILKSVLAQFLELGADRGSGSRAVSEDHRNLFMKAMETIANNIIDEINKNLIPELVDLNFNDIEEYPKLSYSGISDEDVKAIADAYSTLTSSKAVTPTEDDEQYFRALLGLPERKNDKKDKKIPKEPAPTFPGQPAPAGPEEEPEGKGKAPEEEEPEDAAAKKEEEDQEDEGNAEAEVEKATKENDKKQTKKKEAHEHAPLPRRFAEGDFQSWRPLTFAEKKVNWSGIQEKLDTIEEGFSKEAKDALKASKDEFMRKLHRAIEDGDLTTIATLEIKFIDQYKTLLKDGMKEAYEYSKNAASAEMKVKPIANNAKTLATINLRAEIIAKKTAGEIESKAKLYAANTIMQRNAKTLQAAGQIDAALETAIDRSVDQTAGMIFGQAVNDGRRDVFEKHSDKIYALQRSEILDERTCEFCRMIDGVIIKPDDPWAKTDVFHSYCRGIWVEIMADQEEKPEMTGIPSDVADFYRGQPNELDQPRKTKK